MKPFPKGQKSDGALADHLELEKRERWGDEGTCSLSALDMSLSGSDDELAMAETNHLLLLLLLSPPRLRLLSWTPTTPLACAALSRAAKLSRDLVSEKGERGIRFLLEIRAASAHPRPNHT
uniref:Uncharacterized protein n=1 Tax=Oryza glumipatula TaxID=40148 RepID=A0A0D9ZQR7_9ORYZ